MQAGLTKFRLPDEEHAKLPAGISRIFSKDIVPCELERRTLIYNNKYRKVDFAPASVFKPISKILTLSKS